MADSIGLLHPGAMGSVLASVVDADVVWASEGRSAATRARAEASGLRDVGSLDAVASTAELILSVCPPESAEDVAKAVVSTGFTGLYVDANAVSPSTARGIAELFERFVDGGIVGPPPTGPGLTRLYLAGPEAATVAELFASTVVDARIVEGSPGAASAVKMCYAAWTKGTSALLLAIRALAEAEGVTDDLLGEWATSLPDLVGRSSGVIGAVGPKAWRFEGEMREIAATFAARGLPDEFHRGAAEIYHRLASLKDESDPELAQALRLLLG